MGTVLLPNSPTERSPFTIQPRIQTNMLEEEGMGEILVTSAVQRQLDVTE